MNVFTSASLYLLRKFGVEEAMTIWFQHLLYTRAYPAVGPCTGHSCLGAQSLICETDIAINRIKLL